MPFILLSIRQYSIDRGYFKKNLWHIYLNVFIQGSYFIRYVIIYITGSSCKAYANVKKFNNFTGNSQEKIDLP